MSWHALAPSMSGFKAGPGVRSPIGRVSVERATVAALQVANALVGMGHV